VAITNPVTLAGGELATRSGDLSSFNGPVTLTGDTTTVLRSFTTPANDQNLTIGGHLSGAVTLTILGNASNATSGKAFILTNPANDFSGTFVVSANQRLRSAPANTGSTLGTAALVLNGGTLQVRDDGVGSGVTIPYNNNLTVGAGGGVIDVDPAVGVNADNTIQLGTLAIGSETSATTSISNYGVSFSGAGYTKWQRDVQRRGTVEVRFGDQWSIWYLYQRNESGDASWRKYLHRSDQY
jgi:hypothetical protein